jgi:hypothetical protein
MVQGISMSLTEMSARKFTGGGGGWDKARPKRKAVALTIICEVNV